MNSSLWRRAFAAAFATLLLAGCGAVVDSQEAEAGEPWHPFVQWTLEQGLAGLENLSMIPGTVGAAPIQNIGAYGVEVKDVLHSLVALDRQTGELREFRAEECGFAYRDSRFKREKYRWIATGLRLR